MSTQEEVHRVREEIAAQILAQQEPCSEHPMPFPKPSCWTCGRNGAFQRAARIALGRVSAGLSVACSTPSIPPGFGPLRVRHELCVTGCACPCHETKETEL